MQRLDRPTLLTLASAVSLLLFIATAAAWAFRYRAHGRLSFRLPTGRYTLRSHEGRLVLFAPPARATAATGDDQAAAAEVVSRMRNADAGWLAAWARQNGKFRGGIGQGFEWVPRSPPSETHWSKTASYQRPL